MFFFLSKLLGFFLSPYSIAFSFLFLTLLVQKPKLKRFFLITTFLLFYFFSNCFLVDEFSRNWEYKALDTCKIVKPFEYGIILGGLSSYDNKLKRVNFSVSADRLLQGVQLLKTGKIKKIIISGGVASISGNGFKESEYLRDYLVSIGISDSLILIENKSRNTYENAVFTAELLKSKSFFEKCLLITSGYHLPRAMACFKKAEVKVIPYSTERYSGDRKYQFSHCLVPSLEAMRKFEYLAHEWVGYFIYKLMNYI